MKTDLYTKSVLTLIAVMLTVLVAMPLVAPTSARAATSSQYVVKRTGLPRIEKDINGYAARGWEVVSVVPEGSSGVFFTVVFRRQS